MPYLVDQLIEDFRSDVADRADIDGSGQLRDTLWSETDVLRYANQAQARLAADLLSLRKNFTITLEAGKANYRAPYTLKEIVRARMTYPATGTTGKLLDPFDLDDGFVEDDYGITYITTRDLETRTGQPRYYTRDYDPAFVRFYPLPDDVGMVYINATIEPQVLYPGVPLAFDSQEDHHLLLLWMKNLAYRKQDADVLDLARADRYKDEYNEAMPVRKADIDRDTRDGGVLRTRW